MVLEPSEKFKPRRTEQPENFMFDNKIRREAVGVILASILISGMGQALVANDTTQPDKPIMAPMNDSGTLFLVSCPA